ncbi:outer membrane receptor protein involved in Fe transport [Polymorphobacter multimanifer]|uniref:Outer membrane receptor protein involved in Fe transport n=1 Tax=Polymorphobacter multimanifer TaxID=1070431 RepID=A0A841L2Q6_9SPHN|nr:TonB-dependent receptor [Polymorphobacter multimanifer]MBB6226710.1 outer membrane receptor protein involved in Fe transport [Polymorphobacter multimanifer]
MALFASSFGSALRCSSATLALALLPVPALAQSAPQENVPATSGAEPTTAAASGGVVEEEAIVVTGSLIRNPNLVSSQPVTVTTAETIQLRAANVAEEVLRDIPGVVPSIGSAVNNGNGGASFVDLRGIGENRNLVLLDGTRLTPSGLAGVVDLNNIPLTLIQRVDNLTGGAVTTYGADAISGVVNFITRRDFSGVELQVSNGITEAGDGQVYRGDLTIGANFEDGRGNATLSFGYQKSDAVFQGDRDFSFDSIDSYTGGAGGSGTAIPSRLTGLRPIDPATGLPSTNPDVPNGNLQIDPATGTARNLFSPFNFNPFNIFRTPFERYNMFGQARYEINDAIEVYGRGLFSRNTVSTIIAPSGVFGSDVTVPLSNPFLPAGVRSQLCASNVGESGTYVPRFTPAECAAAATATSPTDPAYRTVTAGLARRTTELGPRQSDYRTTLFDFNGGVRGKITDTVNWDVSGSYGESENIQTIAGYALTSRANQSLLATNPNTCLNDAGGCVPANFFGPEGSISPEAANFLTASSSSTVRTSLAQVRALVTGDLGFALPTAGDAIGFALGGEYRKYRAEQTSDLLAQTPGELGGFGGANPNITGGYTVKEVYGEINAPLVQDRPFFENLTLEAGARYSQYDVQAPGNPSFDAFTWKAGGSWAIAGGFKVRGNYSRAVRAPNIGELFTPAVVGLTNLGIDPCAGSGAAPGTNPTLAAVCVAQGAPSSTLGGILNPTAAQANAVFSGNTNLRPEKADTWTAGVVFQPTFVRGLAITVDYYDIRVNDAITSALPGDVIGACFNNLSAASASSAECLGIRRNPATGGLDGPPDTTLGLPLPTTNSGRIFTRGIDGTVSYSTSFGDARISIVGNANYTINARFQASPSSADRECIGVYSPNCSFTGSIQPKFQSSVRTTVGLDSFDLSLLWRYIDPVRFEQQQFDEDVVAAVDAGCADPTGADPDGCVVDPGFRRIGAYHNFDLTGRVNVLENLTLIATVTNLFDRRPPLVGASVGSTAFNSGNTFPSTYDALGRRYTVQGILRF